MFALPGMKYPTHVLLLLIFAAVLFCSVQACRSKPPANSKTLPNRLDSRPRTDPEGMILINGGKYLMGTEQGMAYEAPAHEVIVRSFWMDRHEVTVAEFGAFVSATGYPTDAEKFGWSGAFNLKTKRWEKTKGA